MLFPVNFQPLTAAQASPWGGVNPNQDMSNALALKQQAVATNYMPSLLQQKLLNQQITNKYLPLTLGTQAFANAGNTIANLGHDRMMDMFAPGWLQNNTQGLADLFRNTGVNPSSTNPDLSGITNAQENVTGKFGSMLDKLLGQNSGSTTASSPGSGWVLTRVKGQVGHYNEGTGQFIPSSSFGGF
jgi:hypothetical protein